MAGSSNNCSKEQLWIWQSLAKSSEIVPYIFEPGSMLKASITKQSQTDLLKSSNSLINDSVSLTRSRFEQSSRKQKSHEMLTLWLNELTKLMAVFNSAFLASLIELSELFSATNSQ